MKERNASIISVIFDWGGVLIDNPSEDLIKFCAFRLGVMPDDLKPVFSKFADDFQTGTIGECGLWQKVCGELSVLEPVSVSLWKDAVKAVFNDKPEVFELAQRLRKEGLKVGFLSNTEKPAMEYFFEKGYAEYFDAVTFSCAESVAKPDAQIYLIAAQKLGVKPEEAVFIDDRPDYIAGAVKAGMKGIVFENYDLLINELKRLSVIR
jgi:putative hydrolase of the HAD superfamily